MSAPPVSLLEAFASITSDWRQVFPQMRSYARAVRQALGGLLCLGRRTLTRILWTFELQRMPWAAEYHLHSRCQWEPQDLFDSIWRHGLPFCKGPLVGVALDDTRLHKAGRCIKQAFYQRDPLSPAFHCNLMFGLRFLQASLLVPTHRESARFGARALPVRFAESPRVKGPGKKASQQQLAEWKEARRKYNLSCHAVRMFSELRASLDAAGGRHKTLQIVGDGSFCNRTCFGAVVERTELLVRTRKDAVLCRRAPEGQRRFYDLVKFTPEAVRKDDTIPWQTTKLPYGGKRHKVRYKQGLGVYWQRGGRKRMLRLIVVAPTPYRRRGKLHYRAPAYLLGTDLKTPAPRLIQLYLDRWQIEVNHREEKDTLGVGQAQLRNEHSVPRQPVLAVAAYSALLLAGLIAFGAGRGAVYAQLPAWRRTARRPSCLDLIALLRHEVAQRPPNILPFPLHSSHAQSVAAAAA